jgi:hypothetical protein
VGDHNDALAVVIAVEVVEEGAQAHLDVGEGLTPRRAVCVFARLAPAARLVGKPVGDRRTGQHLEVAEQPVDQPVVGGRRREVQAGGLGGDPPRLAGPQVRRGDHHLGTEILGQRGEPTSDRGGLLDADLGELDVGVAAGEPGFHQALRVGLGERHVGGALPVPDKDQFGNSRHEPNPIRGSTASKA